MDKKRILKISVLIIVLFFLCIIIYYRCLFVVKLKVSVFSHEDSINLDYKAYYKGKDVTNEVIVDKGTFDGRVGKYEVTFTYWYNDKKYSEAKKISIVDTVSPVITLIGDEKITIIEGEEYQELGFTASDNYDGDLKDKVVIDGNVDTKKTNVYKLKYTVEDSSRNKSEVTREITVISKKLPNDDNVNTE